MKDDDKPLILNFAKKLKNLGFDIYGTGKTADKLNENAMMKMAYLIEQEVSFSKTSLSI